MDHQETIAWWKKQAPTYFTDMVFSFSHEDLIQRLDIQPVHRILEIGFGYGRELSQFCKLSVRVHGLEVSEYTCDLARRQLEKQGIVPLPNLQVYDGRTLPFEEDSFDLVYSCFLLQHMSRAAAKDLIREALRVTTPKGRVLMEFFGDPVYRHASEDRFNGNPDDGGGMYNNAYTVEDVHALVDGLGVIEWIDSRPVYPAGAIFFNRWLCITN